MASEAGVRGTDLASEPPDTYEVGSRRRSPWQRSYLAGVLVGDAFGVLLAGLIAQLLRFGNEHPTPLSASFHGSYLWVSVGLAPLWLLTLALSKAFDQRRLGAGADEYRSIMEASFRFLAVIAGGAFLLHLSLFSRLYVLFLLPLTPGFTIIVHRLARRWLHRRRALGLHLRRTVVVGSVSHVSEVVNHLRAAPFAGLRVVGVCLPEGITQEDLYLEGEPTPVIGRPDELAGWLKRGGAQEVIVADAAVFGPGSLRRLTWELEQAGIDLIVAPTVTQFAGPRIAVRQVAGLPLLHVEAPRLDGFSRLIKGSVERLFAVIMLLLLSPLLLAVAVAVKATSRGPALFAQRRIGKGGELFVMLKFRTMIDGADSKVSELTSFNEADGCLFKIREDPRITKVGRVLRRYSIDELPQLVHVLTGKMSVVGPRPLPARELAKYDDEAWRRLLVRPGLTGLWQISGRWELSWQESVRLDLYYVENWSLSLDAVIVAKTLGAILRDRGSA